MSFLSVSSKFAFCQVSRSRRCALQLTCKAVISRKGIHLSRRFAEEKKSFRGQLYESTAQRLEREREEQRRFARERGANSGGRNAAITFSQALLTPRSSGTDAI